MFKMKKTMWLLVSISLITLAACGGGAEASPTVDPGAIYTAAVETAYVQLTQTAMSVTDTPAATVTPMITNTPLVTNTPLAGVATSTPFSLATVGPTQSTCDNFLFLGDVSIPDGTVLDKDESFTKIWEIQNLGPCTWTTGYGVAYAYGSSQMGGVSPQGLAAEVAPGDSLEVSIDMVAPSEPGSYSAAWRMYNDKGYFFGIFLTVVIVVDE